MEQGLLAFDYTRYNMVEQSIEQAVIDAIKVQTNGVTVTNIAPNPESVDSFPLIIVNLASGNCQSLSMNDNTNYLVDASLNVDIIAESTVQRNTIMTQIITAINSVVNVYKISLSSFKNFNDKTMQKPLFIRENVFKLQYKESYSV